MDKLTELWSEFWERQDAPQNPKFKFGDQVRYKETNRIYTVIGLLQTHKNWSYTLEEKGRITGLFYEERDLSLANPYHDHLNSQTRE